MVILWSLNVDAAVETEGKLQAFIQKLAFVDVCMKT